MSSFLRELKRRNVVRVAILYAVVGWVVAQVADVTMPRLGIPEWGVSLVLMLLVLGFPVALVFAWIFELTPEGLKRTQEVEDHASTAHLAGRKLDFLIIGVLAAALVFVGYQAYAPRLKPASGSQTPKPPGGAGLASIAVLPFVDMSQAKDQEYLTDGISEELLNVLARVEGFKVTGRTSAFAFKGHNEDLRVIGQKLGVDHILEGSVRKQGDRIRVTAQLVKAADGYHLWSETYDRQLDDVFAVQDDIAKQVVAAIRRALGKEGAANPESPAERPPTDNVQAYTHFLRGQQLLRARDRVGMEAALTEFERAVELDGDFSRAHVGIAKSLALLASYGERGLAEVAARIEDELSRAAELKPGFADTYAARALWLDVKSAPEKEQIPLLERAADGSPSDTETLVWLSRAYGNSGRLQDALRTFERAYSLDPLYPLMLSNYAIVTYSVGYVDRADRLIDELATLQPNSPILFRTRSILADMDTRPDQSIRWLAAAAKLDPEDASIAARLTNDYWALGDARTGLRHATRLSELTPRDSWGPALQVGLRVLAGDLAKARSSLAAVEAMFPDDHSDVVAAARGVVHTAAGEFTKALEAQLESAPSFREEVPVITWGNNYWNAPLTAFLFRKTGNDAQARRIADALRRAESVAAPPDGQPRSWPLPERAAMAAVMGDRAQILESLTKLYDNGGMISAVMSSEPLSEPWFRPYRGDTEIEALFAKFDARRKEWRQQLAAEGL